MLHVEMEPCCGNPNFGAVVRFIANKFWLPFSKSGDVRVYSKRELGKSFIIVDLKQCRFIKKEKGCFLKLKNELEISYSFLKYDTTTEKP